MKYYYSYLLLLTIFLSLPSNIYSQDVIFKSCMQEPNLSESYLCEFRQVGKIIDERILSLCREYKRFSQDSKIDLSFKINDKGVLTDISLQEFSKFSNDPLKTQIMIEDTVIQDFNIIGDFSSPSNNDCKVKLTIANYGEPIPETIDANKITLDIPKRETYKIVQFMPVFPGCEDISFTSEKEKQECSKQKLLDYVSSNLIYPYNSDVHGAVIVQFVIEVDGSISNIKVLRSIGKDCDESAINLIQSMNKFSKKWTPGVQRGKPVRVLYTLPIKFKLP